MLFLFGLLDNVEVILQTDFFEFHQFLLGMIFVFQKQFFNGVILLDHWESSRFGLFEQVLLFGFRFFIDDFLFFRGVLIILILFLNDLDLMFVHFIAHVALYEVVYHLQIFNNDFMIIKVFFLFLLHSLLRVYVAASLSDFLVCFPQLLSEFLNFLY